MSDYNDYTTLQQMLQENDGDLFKESLNVDNKLHNVAEVTDGIRRRVSYQCVPVYPVVVERQVFRQNLASAIYGVFGDAGSNEEMLELNRLENAQDVTELPTAIRETGEKITIDDAYTDVDKYAERENERTDDASQDTTATDHAFIKGTPARGVAPYDITTNDIDQRHSITTDSAHDDTHEHGKRKRTDKSYRDTDIQPVDPFARWERYLAVRDKVFTLLMQALQSAISAARYWRT